MILRYRGYNYNDYRSNYNNNIGLNKKVVDLAVVIGFIATLYIAYINTQNYKMNIKSLKEVTSSTGAQEKIYELIKDVKENLIEDEKDVKEINIYLD